MKSLLRILKVWIALFLCANTALPCTSFMLKGGGRVYFGRNLDWFWEDGLVIINPRGIRKTAFLMTGGTPAKWTARLGSVTFNQFGREMPFGGMNEAGLVVENMQLPGTGYEASDARPSVNLTQWIQYQLDNCRTVEEVIATDKQLRIEDPPQPLRSQACMHYLVCDASGDCATIEFLGGKMVAHHQESLPCPVLANDTYETSTNYLRQHPLPAELPARAKNPSSLSRFAHAAGRTAAYKPSQPAQDVAYAFDTLDQVAQPFLTVWSMVYDASSRQIHFRTRSNRKMRDLDLKAMDFSPTRPVQYVDIKAAPADNGTLAFAELTEARHRQYLDALFAQPTVAQALGDLTPVKEGLLMTLRGYRAEAGAK